MIYIDRLGEINDNQNTIPNKYVLDTCLCRQAGNFSKEKSLELTFLQPAKSLKNVSKSN